jgi:hypothetical protein
MDILVLFLLIVAGCYLAPLLMPGRAWLLGLAGVGVLAGLGLWFGWVEQQTDSLGSGISALFVMSVGGALALGVVVRAIMLWRGWTGGKAVTAGVIGALVWVAAIAWALWYG